MVSARAGEWPTYAIRRTVAAAPVTTFTPPIPGIPFMACAGSTAIEPGHRLIPSQYPAPPYSARKRDGTPRRPDDAETLDVGHPGHTSDLQRNLGGLWR